VLLGVQAQVGEPDGIRMAVDSEEAAMVPDTWGEHVDDSLSEEDLDVKI
jgi:hypothetical protein